MSSQNPDLCELCLRQGVLLTRHHLIPKSQHHRRVVRATFTKEQRQELVAWLCRPCHSAVHRAISESELAKSYHSVEKLKNHPELMKFVTWLSAKPSGFNPKTPSRR